MILSQYSDLVNVQIERIKLGLAACINSIDLGGIVVALVALRQFHCININTILVTKLMATELYFSILTMPSHIPPALVTRCSCQLG